MIFEWRERNIVFVSVLGVNFKIGKFDKLGVCDERTTEELQGILDKYNTSVLFFDFTSIVYKDDQKVFERMLDLKQNIDRGIYFFNLEYDLANRLRIDFKNSNLKFHESSYEDGYFSANEILCFSLNLKEIEDELTVKLKGHDLQKMKQCSKKGPNCETPETEKLFQLPSTPYWTNFYFDIGALFQEKPIESAWILSRLCNKFRQKIRNSQSILLISTSLYSNVLTSLMKEVLADSYVLDTLCYDRLGPDLLLNEISLFKPAQYDNIINVCDFIIGGTELKILKALLVISKLSVTHIFAIGTFLNPLEYNFDGIDIETLYQTNEIEPTIKYSLTY